MDELLLKNAQARILDELGPEALVDAAGVASNFERMVRIADSTGISLNDFGVERTVELRQNLGIDQFHSVTKAASSGKVSQQRRNTEIIIKSILR